MDFHVFYTNRALTDSHGRKQQLSAVRCPLRKVVSVAPAVRRNTTAVPSGQTSALGAGRTGPVQVPRYWVQDTGSSRLLADLQPIITPDQDCNALH